MTTAFHETLREANHAAWEAMQAHPFVCAIEADCLKPADFLRYLSFERDFVAAAIPIFAHAVLKAPGLAEQRHLIAALSALAEEQIPYFDHTFAALRATPLARENFPPSVNEFREYMHAVAGSGSYAEIMAAMLAAESMYATWCGRAAARPVAEPHLARWVALHAAPDFRRQVAWLEQQVDAAAAAASPEEQEILVRRFGETLRLEFGFHTAALKAAAGGVRQGSDH